MLLAAYRNSAYCAVADFFVLDIERVSLLAATRRWKQRGGFAGGVVLRSARNADRTARLVAWLAGEEAAARFLGEAPGAPPSVFSEALKELKVQDEELSGIRQWAAQLVTERWQGINALAQALARQQELDATTIDTHLRSVR
jgi:ABC-type glycerol-3-phosphate transport system substrate-binding protein